MMGSMYSLKKPPEKSFFEVIAQKRQMQESFIEKDWYITQVISTLSKLNHPHFHLVFSGGTALSKAHQLIHRFSEDIDFRLVSQEASPNRAQLSTFKKAIMHSLQEAGFALDPASVKARDENRFFSLSISYPALFMISDALRPHIQVEIATNPLFLAPAVLSVRSFVTEYFNILPEVEGILCIHPAENAADKLSALSWRIPDRDRTDPYDDPSIIRHLHDLAILKEIVVQEARFPELVEKAMNKDQNRPKHNTDFKVLSMEQKCTQMLEFLKQDKEYATEYNQFVIGTSYAPLGYVPDYQTAVLALEELVDYTLKNAQNNSNLSITC